MISTMYPQKSSIHDSSNEHAFIKTTKEGHSDNWDVLSDSNSDQDSAVTNEIVIDAIHRCKSLPTFSVRNTDSSPHKEDDNDDGDEFSDIDSSFGVQSLQTEEIPSMASLSSKEASDDWSMISSTHQSGNLKKIPSFKDMLLKNSVGGDATNKQHQARIELQEKLKNAAGLGRKTITPTFIVSNDKVYPNRLKRCGFSTGDLQSASAAYPAEIRQSSSQETTKSMIPEEEEILGETDAQEFYHQKSMGKSSHIKGLKLRPDEAKEKNIV